MEHIAMEFDRQSMVSVESKHTYEKPGSDIKKTGYLKKLKTMKKKFFILRSTSSSGPARLEYYDSEKKYRSGHQPKRPIHLHTCFNINKKSDSRHGKYGIVLYTSSEECFTVLTDSEIEQEAWLAVMLEFQNEYLPEGDMHKEHYEHVWQVTLQHKGLGQGRGNKGNYRLCLNSNSVSLVKANSSQPQFTIQLVTIRTVAHNDCSFRLEVGKYAPTGEGEFWFSVEDSNIAKDMHSTLLHYMNSVQDASLRQDRQTRRESHSSPGRRRSSRPEPRPPSYCPSNSGWQSDSISPSSPNYPLDQLTGQHRPRSDTGESRTSRISIHSSDIMMMNCCDQIDVGGKDHISLVPIDMSPPPSPHHLDEQMTAYLEMDMQKRSGSSLASVTPATLPSNCYLTMNMPAHGHSQKGELSPSIPEEPGLGYMSMHPHPSHMSAPIPIHSHSFSEPHHPTPLPTVREGGSSEGYLPMDLTSSPASSSGVLRPDPTICMLSDDVAGLPPRTYSLGSKPVNKKYSGYVEMGIRKGAAGADMSRATSAPHIIHNLKGRREREHAPDSSTPSASPLSMSVKSDDSDSFMEYLPMRPRTSSDSFNYRTRTSSFSKIQQNCRPRSSSHGQGTRPFIKFSKLTVEQARISQDPMQRTSRESSLQGSFDSLRVSNESLRRMSQDMRQFSGSNASDYADMRGTPSPQSKIMDGYVNMQVGAGGRKSSPHRMRTDSSGSGHRPDIKSSSSERLHQKPHLQHIDDYTEMSPVGSNIASSGDSYMNMECGARHNINSDAKSQPSITNLQSSRQTDSAYVNMDDKNKKSDGGRSLSMENVDTYVMYDPSHSGNKPRTGSLGSKDKKMTKPDSAKKPSSASMPSSASGASLHQSQIPSSVSTCTCTGGSSDSIRKAARQSSIEKYGSLGKDFRKKSESVGSRPSNTKSLYGAGTGKDQHIAPLSLMPLNLKVDKPTDEYIEFAPTVKKTDSDHHHHHHGYSVHPHPGPSHSSAPISTSSWTSSFPSGGNVNPSRFPNPIVSPAEEAAYTMYNPAPSSGFKSTNYQQALPGPHHRSQFKCGHAPSSVPSEQAKQVKAKDFPEYVGFEPVVKTSTSSSFSSSSSVKQSESSIAPEYVEYEPNNVLSLPSQSSEYVGYGPSITSSCQASAQAARFVSPNSTVSYIQSAPGTASTRPGKLKQHSPRQQNVDSASKASKPGPASDSLFLAAGALYTEPATATVSTTVSRPFFSVFARSAHPTTSALETSHSYQPLSPSITVTPKSSVPYTSGYMSYNPVKSFANEPSQNNTNVSSGNNDTAILNPPMSPLKLTVDVSYQVPAPSTDIKNNDQDIQMLKQQQQLHPQSVLRQLSAPAAQTSPSNSLSMLQESGVHLPSPQPMSPLLSTDSSRSARQKHFSGSSVTESPSPTAGGTRHKHLSGSSTSSQRSRCISSDSEKSLKKGSKSDSNSSLNSSSCKSKRQILSGDKSPGSSTEKSPLSPSHSSGEVFYGETSSLEAKIIPVEAKIRHSLGDMTGVVNKESQSHHSLNRPGSTPCMQNLDPVPDQGSRSAGDMPSPRSRTAGLLQFPVGPRSRYSLSDLGAYQQMAFASPGLAALSSECSNSQGSSRNGSGENCSSSNSDGSFQPLNYVKLDLKCSEGQGDADGKSPRVKSRNSSDADEKQPPLSYAEIDFVKSQNWNKAL